MDTEVQLKARYPRLPNQMDFQQITGRCVDPCLEDEEVRLKVVTALLKTQKSLFLIFCV